MKKKRKRGEYDIFDVNTQEGRAARARFIVARRAERFTYKHIAKLLGISPARVQQIYTYAVYKGYQYTQIT